MVGLRAGLVDFGNIRSPVVGAKDIVNAHDDGIAIEGAAESVARAREGIVETAGNDTAVRVGNGRVVEISTEDDIAAAEGIQIVG